MNLFEYFSFIKKYIVVILIVIVLSVAVGAYLGSRTEFKYSAGVQVWTNHPDLLSTFSASRSVLEKSVVDSGVNLDYPEKLDLRVSSRGNIVSLDISYIDPETVGTLLDSVLKNSIEEQNNLVSEVGEKNSVFYTVSRTVPEEERNGKPAMVKYIVFSVLFGFLISVIGIIVFNYVKDDRKRWIKAKSS